MTGFKDTQPGTRNLLNTDNFQLIIQKFPGVTYFAQSANIPDINSEPAIQPTNFADIPRPGDKVQFDDFVVTFLVDEDLANWRAVFEWIKTYGRAQVPTPEELSEQDLVCDIDLLTTKNSFASNKRVTFRDAFPISLTGIDFGTEVTDANPVTATVTFRYCVYDLLDLTGIDICD